MKSKLGPLSVIAIGLIFGSMACNKKADHADATQPLQQSFQSAEPAVQQSIASATTSLKAGNYAEATRALTPVVTTRQLTEAQKQAVGVALQQINQAIATNPKLDTKEMYEMRQKLFQAVRGNSRF
jgi:predicted negative regulator of RcsB-dependent stress response